MITLFLIFSQKYFGLSSKRKNVLEIYLFDLTQKMIIILLFCLFFLQILLVLLFLLNLLMFITFFFFW